MIVSFLFRKTRNQNNIPALAAFTVFLLSLILLILLSASCRLYRLERNLDPDNAEFLSKVRYIITKQERKIFLESPDSEKEAFREEFWRVRDPDPGTEENEFKREYFDRMDIANQLFISEAIPGWLTDRGRIYILFGPPFDRLTYPMGNEADSRCQEIWYYGNFPVVFVDRSCTGQYKLVTYNLTSLNEFNLMYMHELNKAQDRLSQTIAQEKDSFDFNWRVKKNIIDKNRIEGTVYIDIPYKDLWFNAEEAKLKAILSVQLDLIDFENNTIWEHAESLELILTDAELQERKEKKYSIEVPVNLKVDLDRLRQGKSLLHAVVKNLTGDQEMKKVMEFRF